MNVIALVLAIQKAEKTIVNFLNNYVPFQNTSKKQLIYGIIVLLIVLGLMSITLLNL
jgi:hypothetical protein